jgi:hypothetical protein
LQGFKVNGKSSASLSLCAPMVVATKMFASTRDALQSE